MPTLILLRHGKAVPATGEDDHGRPLTRRGREDATRAAEAIARRIPPDVALVSDARRTRDTFACCKAVFGPDVVCRLEPSLYLALPSTILDLVAAVPGSVETLLIVGHNPGLGELARSLARAGDTAALARLGGGFATSSFVILALLGETWGEVATGGRLEEFFGVAGRGSTRSA